MALTEAQKETLLLNLEANMSELSRTNQILLDIFRAGGVANPDLAVLEGTLKAWVQSNYIGLTGNQTIAGEKTFSNNMFFSGSSQIFKKAAYSDSNTNTANTQLYMAVEDSNSLPLSWVSIRDMVENGYKQRSASLYVRRSNNNELGYLMLTSSQKISDGTEETCVACSNRSIDNIKSTDVINRNLLDNLGNSVLHKEGVEYVTGLKTFNNIYGKNFNAFDENFNLSTDALGKYSNFGFLFYDNSYNLFGSIVHQVSLEGRSSVVLYTSGVGEARTSQAFLRMFVDQDKTSGVDLQTTYCITRTIYPNNSNSYSCGRAGNLWSEVYAGNGTIQTSDERVKENISDIPEAVMRAWGKVNFKQFQFKDAVAEKGVNARIHTGLIAQHIKTAFQSEGLDAERYGLFCFDRWTDQYEDEQVLVKPEVRGQVKVVDAQAMYNTVFKEDGTTEEILVSPEKSHLEEQVIEEAVYRTEKKLVKAAGEQYALRYEQCLCMEAAYQRWILKKIADKVGVTM